MKKAIVLMVVVLLAASVAMAGDGKGCDAKAHAAKSVTLTGTLSTSGEHKVFRVSNADGTQYTVCAQSKADLSSFAEGATVRVKGKVVKCSETSGEELVIENATKI